MIDVTQIKQNILKKNINENNQDLQFIAAMLKQYSIAKKCMYGDNFNYSLDVEIDNSILKMFGVGQQFNTNNNVNLPNYLLGNNKIKNNNLSFDLARFFTTQDQESENVESECGEYPDTASEYEFKEDSDSDVNENTKNEALDKILAIAHIETKRGIVEKGIEIKNVFTENINIVDKDETIIWRYVKYQPKNTHEIEKQNEETNIKETNIENTIENTTSETNEQHSEINEIFDTIKILEENEKTVTTILNELIETVQNKLNNENNENKSTKSDEPNEYDECDKYGKINHYKNCEKIESWSIIDPIQ